MRQLEYIQILYTFHFDSLPKNEHETRARFLPRALEFSKGRNDESGLGQGVRLNLRITLRLYGCVPKLRRVVLLGSFFGYVAQ